MGIDIALSGTFIVHFLRHQFLDVRRLRPQWIFTDPKYGWLHIVKTLFHSYHTFHSLVSLYIFSGFRYLARINYSDVTMGILASQTTFDFAVYRSVCLDEHHRKHQRPRYWPFCGKNPPVTGGFPSQKASYMEIVSIPLRHHVTGMCCFICCWDYMMTVSVLITLLLLLFNCMNWIAYRGIYEQCCTRTRSMC